MSLFDQDDNGFKAACHGATLTLGALLSAYNWIVWQRRGTAWHLGSTVIYSGLCALEILQIGRHLKEHR